MKEKKIKFKNDKERIAFLEDHRDMVHGWYMWKDDIDLRREWWRLDLDTCSLIVEEREQTIMWPERKLKWLVSSWYIIRDWNIPFEDGKASRTLALEALKEAEKRWKEE